MSVQNGKLIADLPTNSALVGTELLEIQNGTGTGASQQTTAAQVAALANPHAETYAAAQAATAQTNAETYAAAQAATAQTNAQIYAAAQATTAQTNAQTYAAAQAATAQTNAQTYSDSQRGVLSGINAQTVAYTLVLADRNKDVQVTSATAVNITVPTNATAAFAIGTMILVSQLGAGIVTIVGASGVTVQGAFGVATTAQYDGRVLEKTATDTWRVW